MPAAAAAATTTTTTEDNGATATTRRITRARRPRGAPRVVAAVVCQRAHRQARAAGRYVDAALRKHECPSD